MSNKIRTYLCKAYPLLSDIFIRVKAIPRLRPSKLAIPEMVVKVVVNQMLSKHAASSIYNRLDSERLKHNFDGAWQLEITEMRQCGLSAAKCKTIIQFRNEYKNDPSKYENWHKLSYEELHKEVTELWGMSDWTASILGIFYFAHEDVFPSGDGSIQRAGKMINTYLLQKNRINRVLDPLLSKPYRSYLALYLWRALDDGFLSNNLRINKKIAN